MVWITRVAGQVRIVLLLVLLLTAAPAAAAAGESQASFSGCLERLREQARARGLGASLIDRVFSGLELQPRVLELDRAQPEFRQSFAAYLRTRVTKERIWRGRLALVEHAELLVRLTREYGVPGHYLVAFWGLETNYGTILGRVPTLDALATLACDRRRAEFFTEQLLVAVELVGREALEPDRMRGSWAGAMGHTQFMPTVYRDHAVDGDGDGRVDLFSSPADALTSGANYLAALGWQRGERWGREVRLPEDFDYARSGIDQRRSLAEWRAMGVTRADGGPLPVVEGMDAALLVPMGRHGPAFVVYDNFDVIMGWNRSQAYAIAVGHLADRIVGRGTLVAGLPDVERAPAPARIRALQRKLIDAGIDPGEPDGVLGPATRAALRAFQQRAGLPADGYPDAATFRALGLDDDARPAAGNGADGSGSKRP